jgi:hypothetical protein
MVLTNVPGSRRSLSLADAPLPGVLVWAPCSGTVRGALACSATPGW